MIVGEGRGEMCGGGGAKLLNKSNKCVTLGCSVGGIWKCWY